MSVLPLLSRADPRAGPDLDALFRRHRRLPRIGDVPAPWRYRGWQLAYVIGLHGLVPAVADRWGYHLRTLEAGKLLPEPIPQITFGPPENKVFYLLHDWSRLIGRDCGGWGISARCSTGSAGGSRLAGRRRA
jgi:hypothetical protein